MSSVVPIESEVTVYKKDGLRIIPSSPQSVSVEKLAHLKSVHENGHEMNSSF